MFVKNSVLFMKEIEIGKNNSGKRPMNLDEINKRETYKINDTSKIVHCNCVDFVL